MNNSGMKIQCKLCGGFAQSTDRHHMCFCDCGAIAIDGGACYTKVMNPVGVVKGKDGYFRDFRNEKEIET